MARRWGHTPNSKQEPYILFPEIELPDRKAVKEEKILIAVNSKFQAFWKASSYRLEYTGDSTAKKDWDMEVERFSDRTKKKTTLKRGPLHEFLLFRPAYFPKELIGGKKNVRSSKRPRWNQNHFAQLDDFEKREQELDGKETKEGEDEEEEGDKDEEDIVPTDEDEVSEDDYNKNEDFDDDEDDVNDVVDDDEGPLY